jgi:hypothetical protein
VRRGDGGLPCLREVHGEGEGAPCGRGGGDGRSWRRSRRCRGPRGIYRGRGRGRATRQREERNVRGKVRDWVRSCGEGGWSVGDADAR